MPDQVPPNIMVPSQDHQVLEQAYLLAFRQMSDSITQSNKILARLDEKMEQVWDKVTKIEAQDFKAKMADLQAKYSELAVKFDMLKADKDRRDGATSFVEWVSKVGPWLMAMAVAAWAYYSKGMK